MQGTNKQKKKNYCNVKTILTAIKSSIVFIETAKYKTPVFRIINPIDGKQLTAQGPGQEITLESQVDDSSQKW